MQFTRIESIVLYTCSALFAILLFFIFYRVFLIAWKRFLLKVRPQSLEPPDTRQERRVRELLERPSLRNLLASRAEFVEERQRRRDAHEVRLEETVSQAPDGSRNKGVRFENNNSHIPSANAISIPQYSSTDNAVLPPAYDTLSVYSGPPPSYHSDDNS